MGGFDCRWDGTKNPFGKGSGRRQHLSISPTVPWLSPRFPTVYDDMVVTLAVGEAVTGCLSAIIERSGHGSVRHTRARQSHSEGGAQALRLWSTGRRASNSGAFQ